MSDQNAELVAVLTTAVSTILTALLSWLTWKASSWITATTQAAKLKTVMSRIDDAARTAVLAVHQREADSLRVHGGISPAEAEHLRATARVSLRASLGPAFLEDARKVMGLDPSGLDLLLEEKIEAAVRDSKRATVVEPTGVSAPSAPAAPPPPGP